MSRISGFTMFMYGICMYNLHIVICFHVVNVYASAVSIAFYTGTTYRVTNGGTSTLHAYVMVTLCIKC
jgi:phage-related holin